MFKLHLSNKLDTLASVLADDISSYYRFGNDLFRSPMIIVPNMNFAKWLKVTLAKKLSICMNFDFQYLENGLLTILKSVDNEQYKYKYEFLDTTIVELILLFALRDVQHWRHEFLPVYNYLSEGNESEESGFGIKLWQLCKKLALLFRKYEHDRPDMIQSWLNKNKIINEGKMERCQRELYLKVYEIRNKFLENRGIKLFSLYDHYHHLFSRKKNILVRHKDEDKKICFFGFSRFPNLHFKLIYQLKQILDISVYSINPSQEYWGDVKIPWMKKKLNCKVNTSKNYDLFGEIDNDLIALWGKLGRENLDTLYQFSEYDFHMHFMPEHEVEIENTVLQSIKQQILTLTKLAKENIGLKQDCSLQIMACPSMRREVETTYNSILNNLECDKQLLLSEIAIFVTDVSRYKSVINSVFGQSQNIIKYNITSTITSEESVFYGALMSIIELALGEFSRKTVFNLLSNPCVMNYWDYGFKEIDIWARWAAKLGIFRGFQVENNSESCRNLGDTPKSGLYTWRQGLERIRLSRIMYCPGFEIGKPRPNFVGLVPLRDLDTENKELVEKFCNIIEGLHNLTSTLAIKKTSATSWSYLIKNTIKEFLTIPTNLKLEERVFESLKNYLDILPFYDSFSDNNDVKLELNTIKTILASQFSGISESYGNYLTGGVTISSLISLRSIPFKVVYLLGLEEGKFPGKTYDSSLDLRKKYSRVGDADTTESNEYAFLETLISTQKKLYLSYISENPKKNQNLQPCSTINQLKRYTERYILKNNAEFSVVNIPSKGSNSAYFTSNSCDWSDLLVNYSPSDFVSHLNSNFIGRNLEVFSSNIINKMNPDFSLERGEPIYRTKYLDDGIKINVSDISFFLTDPVTAKINLHIGKIENYGKSALDLERENEPANTEYPIKFNLERESIENWILSSILDNNYNLDSDLISCEFDMIYDHYMRKSLTPKKAFAQHDKMFMKEQIVTFTENLLPLLGKMKNSKRFFSDFVLGNPEYNQIIDNKLSKILRCKALVLNVKKFNNDQTYYMPVIIQGSIKWVWEDHDGKWNVLLPVWSKEQRKYHEEHIIKAFLFFLAIVSDTKYNTLSLSIPLNVKFYVAYKNTIAEKSYLLCSDDAQKYLLWLLEDLFDFTNLVWLPWIDIVSEPGRRRLVTKKAIKVQDKKIFFDDINMLFKQEIRNNFILSKASLPQNILEIARKKFRIFLEPTKNE